jgi:hypothetical protein
LVRRCSSPTCGVAHGDETVFGLSRNVHAAVVATTKDVRREGVCDRAAESDTDTTGSRSQVLGLWRGLHSTQAATADPEDVPETGVRQDRESAIL